MSSLQHTVEKETLTLQRSYAAPRRKVWDAFTIADQFVQWWGPKGWETVVKEFQFSNGGVNHYGMHCTDPNQREWYGKYSWGKMVFSEIIPMESFSYKDYFVDESGAITEGMPVVSCVQRFLDEADGTKILSMSTYESEEALKSVLDMGMLDGIAQTWDRLYQFLLDAR